MYEAVKKDQPNVMDKVVAVAGDVTLPGYGLSPTDLQMLIDNVSIVFNSAATVKFDEELKAAIEMNVKGPRQLLEICRRMKNLVVGRILHISCKGNRLLIWTMVISKAFVHVSTAFNNLDREEMREEVYPSTVDPCKLIELIDCLDEKVVKNITQEYVKTTIEH